MDSLDAVAGSVAESRLGPAVTEEFKEALGLQDLVGKGSAGRRDAAFQGSAAPSAPASPAPPQAPPVDFSKLIRQMLQLIDKATSAALDVPSETEEDLDVPADCMTPWVVAHASDVTSETGMRLLALSGLVTFVAMKVIRWSQKPKPKKERPDVATAAEDELQPVRAA